MNVRGVVLAGGDSTRFEGGEKALADYRGRPLVAHVVDAVAGATDGPPLLAVADDDEGERLAAAAGQHVESVVDVSTHGGPLGGVFAASDAADSEWLFVCGCDMPLLTAKGIEALVAAGDRRIDRAGSPAVAAVVPVVDGHDQPLHALYRRDVVLNARGSVPAEAGPMALLDALDGVVRILAAELPDGIERTVTNVNTRADLDRLAESDPTDDR